MIELKPCPFCDGTNLDRYRFTRAGYIDKPAWYEEKSETGDWFRIECDRCGCSFDKHEDELFDCIFNSCDYEITEDELWNVMFEKWNDRASASPSEKEWDYCMKMAKKGEWSGSYETDVIIACAKKVLEKNKREGFDESLGNKRI